MWILVWGVVHYLCEYKQKQSFWRAIWQCLSKCKRYMPFDLVILNLVISPTCARIFSAHYKGKPFIITLMSFSGGNMYVHTEEYFAAMKKNKEKKKNGQTKRRFQHSFLSNE